jgi:hypothetical protein
MWYTLCRICIVESASLILEQRALFDGLNLPPPYNSQAHNALSATSRVFSDRIRISNGWSGAVCWNLFPTHWTALLIGDRAWRGARASLETDDLQYGNNLAGSSWKIV